MRATCVNRLLDFVNMSSCCNFDEQPVETSEHADVKLMDEDPCAEEKRTPDSP